MDWLAHYETPKPILAWSDVSLYTLFCQDCSLNATPLLTIRYMVCYVAAFPIVTSFFLNLWNLWCLCTVDKVQEYQSLSLPICTICVHSHRIKSPPRSVCTEYTSGVNASEYSETSPLPHYPAITHYGWVWYKISLSNHQLLSHPSPLTTPSWDVCVMLNNLFSETISVNSCSMNIYHSASFPSNKSLILNWSHDHWPHPCSIWNNSKYKQKTKELVWIETQSTPQAVTKSYVSPPEPSLPWASSLSPPWASVKAALPKIVQLSAGLAQVQVQVHVHHGGRVLLEGGRDLVEGLASCLRHSEEGEDEEEEKKHCEDEEDIGATKFLWRGVVGGRSSFTDV